MDDTHPNSPDPEQQADAARAMATIPAPAASAEAGDGDARLVFDVFAPRADRSGWTWAVKRVGNGSAVLVANGGGAGSEAEAMVAARKAVGATGRAAP